MPLISSYGFASFGAQSTLPSYIEVYQNSTDVYETVIQAVFSVYTINVPLHTRLWWTIDGTNITDGDFDGVRSGELIIDINGYGYENGRAYIARYADADFLLEGTETFVFNVREESATGRILASSAPITIQDYTALTTITPSASIIYENEGSVTFTVSGALGSANNIAFYYTINQVSGTISSSTFTSNSLNGMFVMTTEDYATATGSFTLNAALEDGNSTDDVFNVNIRSGSINGSILLTSSNIKIVDLTSYYATIANGFGGQPIAFTVGAAGGGAGRSSTLTFKGTKITGGGGSAGTNAGIAGAGGTFSLGDGGVTGGSGGSGSSWAGKGSSYPSLAYAGGGGGAANNAGGTPSQDMGGYMGTLAPAIASSNNRLNGMWAFINSIGYYPDISGPARSVVPAVAPNLLKGAAGKYFAGGGGGGALTNNLTVNNSAYSVATGGAGGIGGGGGGGGIGTVTNSLGQYTYTTQAAGAGGAGCIAIQFNNTASGIFATSGTGYTIPANTTVVKAWAMGGGGGGGGSTSAGTSYPTGIVYSGKCGGGGGGGGTAWKTWTYGPAYYPTKPALV